METLSDRLMSGNLKRVMLSVKSRSAADVREARRKIEIAATSRKFHRISQ